MTKKLKLYTSYSFTSHDPVIEVLRVMVDNSGLSHHKLHLDSGVSTTTFRNWFKGKTRRPQFATVAATTAALGHPIRLGTEEYDPAAGKFSWVGKKSNVVKLPVAKRRPATKHRRRA